MGKNIIEGSLSTTILIIGFQKDNLTKLSNMENKEYLFVI